MTQKDRQNFAFATNTPDALRLDGGDGRFFIVEGASKKMGKGKKRFFAIAAKLMRDDRQVEYLKKWLAKMFQGKR